MEAWLEFNMMTVYILGVDNDTNDDKDNNNNAVVSSSVVSWAHLPWLDSKAFLTWNMTLCYEGLEPLLIIYFICI